MNTIYERARRDEISFRYELSRNQDLCFLYCLIVSVVNHRTTGETVLPLARINLSSDIT